MNILFLVKFYTPFDRGGSEWSTRDLAYLLTKDGHKVTIVTPNYSARSQEIIDGINIVRFPFPIKLNSPKSSIAPFWTSNIIWYILSTIYCLYISLKNRYDIIHVQNNEFLPAGVISAKILGKKTVATFRDYQAICNLGFCLWKSNKACTFEKYLDEDFKFFYENYVSPKTLPKYYLLKMAAVRGRFAQKILYFFAKKIDYKIAVSKKVKEIFETNGIRDLKVINNPIIIKSSPANHTNNKIIFVGKLSRGKGADILIETIPGVLSELNGVTFEIIGTGYLEKFLKDYAKEKGINSKITFAGHLAHSEVLEKISISAIVVVPSVWPEPLPRSVIEAILSGIPVVATKVGGISEILQGGRYGVLSQPNKGALESAIIEGYRKREILAKNIKKDLDTLKAHFSEDAQKAYEGVYQEATQ